MLYSENKFNKTPSWKIYFNEQFYLLLSSFFKGGDELELNENESKLSKIKFAIWHSVFSISFAFL